MLSLIIIDDEYEIRIGLSNYFPWQEIGFKVQASFESPVKALEYMKNRPVDAVLCDIKMPQMTGLEFAKKLRHSTTRVVFLTGYKEFDYLKEAMEYKVFDYLLKPVTHEQIQKTFSALRAELKHQSVAVEGPVDGAESHIGILGTIKNYLEANYATTSLEDTAAHIHLNPNYLSKFFKQKTGENFSDYLIKIKMRNALSLMGNSELKTYHISAMVGYTNPNNFTRAFKRLFGKSPKDYRNIQ